jgi:hypothetical protein
MPVEPAHPLDQQVDRGDIAVHEVEVQIESLLDDLGRDHHTATATGPLTVSAQDVDQLGLQRGPMVGKEAGVQQSQALDPAVEQLEQALGTGHCVADGGDTAARLSSIDDGRRGLLRDHPAGTRRVYSGTGHRDPG